MIRLVVSDIDGTLVGKDEVLSTKAIELSKRLAEAGIYFSVATGRVESLTQYYADKLQLQIPYIACNGATIVYGKEILLRQQIPILPLRSLIIEADAMDMSIIYSQNGVESVWRETAYILQQRKQFSRYECIHALTDDEWETMNVDKVSIITESNDDGITVLEKTCAQLDSRYGYTRYMDRSIELVHKTATKASGVAFLTNYLNIDMNEVLFVGDHQNDIEIIDAAGIGVAVANSTDDVKKHADYLCTHSLVDGLVEAVNLFCFGQKV